MTLTQNVHTLSANAQTTTPANHIGEFAPSNLQKPSLNHCWLKTQKGHTSDNYSSEFTTSNNICQQKYLMYISINSQQPGLTIIGLTVVPGLKGRKLVFIQPIFGQDRKVFKVHLAVVIDIDTVWNSGQPVLAKNL